mgnify:FL=1
MRIHLFVFYIFFGWYLVQGQSISESIEKGLLENDIRKKLPPLDSLLTFAKENSPYLKFLDADSEVWEGRVTVEKRSWLYNVYVEAGYNYGVFDNLTNQQIAGDPQSQTLFSTEQGRFNVGASFKIPLTSVFSRKRNIKNAKAEAEKARYNRITAEVDLEGMIISQYNAVIKSHRMYYISSSILDSYKVQSIRAEKDFENGVINVAEYTRLQQMLNDAALKLESQRAEFIVAVGNLENTVGFKLNI